MNFKRIFIASLVVLCVPRLLIAGAGLCGLCGAKSSLRIVSLLPSNTEIIFALGAGSELVGVSHYCDYPAEAKKIEKIGDFIHPNVEKIFSFKPDIIFAGKWQSSTTVSRLKELGLNVAEVPDAQNLEEVHDIVKFIAARIGREKEASGLIRKFRRELKKISDNAGQVKSGARVYVEIDSPNWTVGGRSFISDVISKSGGTNIFADVGKSYFRTAWETVVERNPDVIISLSAKSGEIAARAGAGKIKAVAAKRVYDDIDKDLLTRPTPRIVETMRILVRLFYSDADFEGLRKIEKN